MEKDDFFFAYEGLVLDLCKELGLEYELAGKPEIVEKIKELKNQVGNLTDKVYELESELREIAERREGGY